MVDATETAPDPLHALGLGKSVATPSLTIAHHQRADLIGQRRAIEGTLALGRGGEAWGPGALDDPLLSRRHAELERRDELVIVRDCDSRNGTFVNGRPVERAVLREGDVLGLGSILFVLGRSYPGLSPPADPSLLGASTALSQVLSDVHAVAPQPVTVLIRGETGVGKELVARRIHELSGRRGPFVAVNCGGMSEGVLQSELFGHVRGAFSGAEADRAGLVESATGGTLLLDEIGDASTALQQSLLRLLQDREFRAVGADQSRKSDARFIAATHVELDDAVSKGLFRQDLLARLRRWVITVPPLRARREDILPIALGLSRRLDCPRIDRALALSLLLAPWPDNVRGLAAILEVAAVDAVDGCLSLSARVKARLDEMRLPEAEGAVPTEWASLEQAKFRKARPDAAYLGRRFAALGGNMKALAEELGVSRNTLYRWFKEAALDPRHLR